MLKSAISSHLTEIYTARKKETEYFINLNKKFEPSNVDIIDVFEVGLNDSSNFNLASPEQQKMDTTVLPKKMQLINIIEKNIVLKEEYKIYKYLFFKVEYGENGQNSRIEKSDGSETIIDIDDWQHREFHGFIAYPYGHREYGVLLLESRGQYSIQGPIEKVLKNCVANVLNNEKLTTSIKPFADNKVVRQYIQNGKVSKLRLIKNVVPVERAQGMRYDETEIIYKRPREGNIVDVLLSIANNTFRVGQTSNVPEIDEFDPDKIKFEVETDSGKRTYTAGSPRIGMIQEEMPTGVVRADGFTNTDKILVEMKRIFESQHINI